MGAEGVNRPGEEALQMPERVLDALAASGVGVRAESLF
jgi:hypothetical protein